MAVSGVCVTIAHFALALFSNTPERYHGHEVLVVVGLALIVIGLLLIGTDKK